MRQFEEQSQDHEGICSADDVITSFDDGSTHSTVSESQQFVDLTTFNVSDARTTTKTQDGPSHATLATNTLIRTLATKKSMARTQVADILQEAAAASHNASTSPYDSKADDRPNAVSPPPHAHLCMAVHDRLRALSERIEARGKASILPCCTRLNRSYLRALRFLIVWSTACISLEEQHVLMAQG